MKSVVTFLQLIVLCFVLSMIMGLFVTPTDAWEAFGSSTEGNHLRVIHILKLITTAAHLSLPLAFVLSAIGGFIDLRQRRLREVANLTDASVHAKALTSTN